MTTIFFYTYTTFNEGKERHPSNIDTVGQYAHHGLKVPLGDIIHYEIQ